MHGRQNEWASIATAARRVAHSQDCAANFGEAAHEHLRGKRRPRRPSRCRPPGHQSHRHDCVGHWATEGFTFEVEGPSTRPSKWVNGHHYCCLSRRPLSRLHGQFDEVVHEHLQGDVVREDHRGVGHRAAEAAGLAVVRDRGVHLGGQEPRLRPPGVRLDVPRDGEAVAQDLLRILGRGLEESLEVGVLLPLLVARVIPCLDLLPAPDHHVEERVQEQDDVGFQGRRVEEHRLRRPIVERVLQQRGLDHHERVHRALADDERAVVGRLVGARVEGLQEVAPPQVVHELREDRQFLGQVEGGWLVLAVVREFGNQADEHPVDPPQHVERVLVFAFVHGVPRHQHRSCLLVESRGDVAHARIRVGMRDGGNPETLAPRRVLVAGLELQEARPPLLRGAGLLGCHIKVEGDGRALVEGAGDPLGCGTLADLGLRNTGPLLGERREAPDSPAALELTGGEDLELGVETQVQVARLVAVEHLAERVLEDVHAEGVAHHHEAAGLVGQHLHLVQPHLVEGAGEDVDGEAAVDGSLGQGGVVLQRLLRVPGVRGVLRQVQVRPDGLRQLLAHDHAGPYVAGPAHDQRDADAALGAGHLREAQCHAERGAGAPVSSAVGARGGPGVAREVVQQGVQRELALRDGREEAPRRLAGHRPARVVLVREAELVRHLLRGVTVGFASPEDIRLREHRVRQLVDADHRPESDEADEGVLRHHRQGLLQRVLRLLQLLLDERRVEHQQEDGGVAHGLRYDVLDGGAHRQQLRREVLLGDALRVVRRERVPLLAERAGPLLRVEVDLAVGVQRGAAVAGPADDRLVLHELQALRPRQRGVQAAQRHDDPRGVQPRARPDVPRHPGTID
mmetsp:Transcript_56745/g.160097  ORF Transcript_56745/g.160097 Transcript_56745/m.160097 type:complete len:852 (+) Transcript_56745:50-2605(+)